MPVHQSLNQGRREMHVSRPQCCRKVPYRSATDGCRAELLNSHAAWHFLTSLASESGPQEADQAVEFQTRAYHSNPSFPAPSPDLYGDPGACVHAKPALPGLILPFKLS